jgi:hypothetical protein
MKHEIVAVSAAADTNNIASGVTASSGAAFTLITDIAGAGDGLAHKIIITPSGSVTGNYTITGKDADGKAFSETLATDTVNAVTSVDYYATDIVVTAPAGLGAETVDIGWTADSLSPQINPKLSRVPTFNLGFGCSVESGTPTYTVQHTYDGETWYSHSTVSAETTAQEGNYTSPVHGIRLLFAAAGGVTFTGYQVEG